jgi:hypothetical protein
MDNLVRAIESSFLKEEAWPISEKLSSAASDSGHLEKVAGINRNRWPL